ncbi:MAG: hypothetical protein RLZ98_841 [Pseudomonadota bacterium]|jgi:carboxyvinyl-carboxyphosphonate phosphorylmutase
MTSAWQERRERFRGLLTGGECILPGSVHDPISARIAHDLGFEAGIFAGSTASLTVLGAPDSILITLTEFVEQTRRITRAAPLPLLVDADHGYGNALNVMRTVEELEVAGVAGLSIEDTLLPAAYGHAGAELITIDEGIGKIRAAVAARKDTSLVIAARTSAPMITGTEDAIARVKAYTAEGPDAIFLIGVASAAQLREIAAATHLPIILGGGGAAMATLEELAADGVAVVLRGHLPIQAATQAVYLTLKAIREGARAEGVAGLPAASLMQKATRDDEYAAWAREFLGAKG